MRVSAYDGNGAFQGSKDFTVREWSQRQVAFRDHFPGVSTENSRLEVEVISGQGKVIAYGSGIANGSQDPTTYEMAYADTLLGISAVVHDATLIGDGTVGAPLGLADGAVTMSKLGTTNLPSPAPQGVEAQAISGPKVLTTTDGVTLWGPGGGGYIISVNGGRGLAGGAAGGDATLGVAPLGITSSMLVNGAVTDAKVASGIAYSKLSGAPGSLPPSGAAGGALSGSYPNPGIAAGQVVTSVNGLKDAVTLAGGTNTTITPSGNTLTIASSGLTLPYAGSAGGAGDAFAATNSGSGNGVYGAAGPGIGVKGTSASGIAVYGWGLAGTGGHFTGDTRGVFGFSASGQAVSGQSDSGTAVHGESTTSFGVYGTSLSGYGVYGTNTQNSTLGILGHPDAGAFARSNTPTGVGVWGVGTDDGVRAEGFLGDGVFGTSWGSFGTAGVHGHGRDANSTGVWGEGSGIGANQAGWFSGNVGVTGTLTKGGGAFKIDHPLDPSGKYLLHSFVESPDMMNVYNGNVVLDDSGEAVVELPEWFEALNRDFRYQLTCIGGFAPVYVAAKVAGNTFRIAGGTPRLEVSWQVTGIRQDAWANAHRIPVEEEKPANEQGYFLHPEAFDQPRERSIEWGRDPEAMRRSRESGERLESLRAGAGAGRGAKPVGAAERAGLGPAGGEALR